MGHCLSGRRTLTALRIMATISSTKPASPTVYPIPSHVESSPTGGRDLVGERAGALVTPAAGTTERIRHDPEDQRDDHPCIAPGDEVEVGDEPGAEGGRHGHSRHDRDDGDPRQPEEHCDLARSLA